MRYYTGLVMVVLVLGMVLGGMQLAAWGGKEDISIALKTLNQDIAPAAISCPQVYYKLNSEITCRLEGSAGSLPIEMIVVPGGVKASNTADFTVSIEAVKAS